MAVASVIFSVLSMFQLGSVGSAGVAQAMPSVDLLSIHGLGQGAGSLSRARVTMKKDKVSRVSRSRVLRSLSSGENSAWLVAYHLNQVIVDCLFRKTQGCDALKSKVFLEDVVLGRRLLASKNLYITNQAYVFFQDMAEGSFLEGFLLSGLRSLRRGNEGLVPVIDKIRYDGRCLACYTRFALRIGAKGRALVSNSNLTFRFNNTGTNVSSRQSLGIYEYKHASSLRPQWTTLNLRLGRIRGEVLLYAFKSLSFLSKRCVFLKDAAVFQPHFV